MSKWAWVYIWVVLVLGGLVAWLAIRAFEPGRVDWLLFFILAGLAALAQLFKIEAPNHQSYHPALMLTFAAVLLLQPALFAAVIVLAHLAEWLFDRLRRPQNLRNWYLQPFNIAMHISLGALAALICRSPSPGPVAFPTGFSVLSGIAAALAYTVLNHLLVGEALFIARGVPWRESGVLQMENVLTDLMMALLGLVLAALLQLNPWLLLPALAPSYLIYRALAVPGLQRQAATDPKTGLWNDRHFMKVLEAELARCARTNRPLTVVVADLDLLRNINNTFGHLAGDAVLIGVAAILKRSVREYDVVARFGGEEFALLLHETPYREALARVESLRQAIEAAEFTVSTSSRPIKATMSFGIAGRNGDEVSACDIIHNADLAVYQAKLRGRNQSCLFSKAMKGLSGITEGLSREV